MSVFTDPHGVRRESNGRFADKVGAAPIFGLSVKDRPDYYEVPFLLCGNSELWPEWLEPVTLERWQHILDEHAPESNSGKPTFDASTNIAEAIFDTIVYGEPMVWNEKERRKQIGFNGQIAYSRCDQSETVPDGSRFPHTHNGEGPREMNEEQLAKQVVNAVGVIPPGDMDSVRHYEKVGEWGQVATSALVGALNAGKIVAASVVEKAIDFWGEPEMGALMDDFAIAWL